MASCTYDRESSRSGKQGWPTNTTLVGGSTMVSKLDPVTIKPNYPTYTKETQAESKLTREVLTATVERTEPYPYPYRDLLRKHRLKTNLRTGALIRRFLDNIRLAARQRRTGPLTTRRTPAATTLVDKVRTDPN